MEQKKSARNRERKANAGTHAKAHAGASAIVSLLLASDGLAPSRAMDRPRQRYGQSLSLPARIARNALSMERIREQILRTRNPTLPRELQQTCSICGNYTLFPEVTPYIYSQDATEEAISCQDLNLRAEGLAPDDLECLGLKSEFLHACCDAPPRHECETRLQSELLSNYNPAVQPENTTSPSAPVLVEFQLDFLHITELSMQEQTTEIFVGLHMIWKDERLAWDVNEHCAYSTTFRASNANERTEIWVPDVDLYNQAVGAQNMPEALAWVYSDGTVYWRRNGGLKALCAFAGLRRMPFDTLGCRYMIGPWTSRIQMLLLDGSGFTVGSDMQPKYAEYRLKQAMVKVGYMTNENATYPPAAVYYDFYFERATRFYVVGIIVPAILFTFLSFGMFLLVLAAHQIVTAQYLPVTNERLFATVLINSSFYWVMFGLLESVLVGYLFFVGHDAARQEAEERREKLSMLRNKRPHTVSNGELHTVDDELREKEENGDVLDVQPERRSGFSYGQSMRSSVTLKQAMIHSKRDVNTNRKLIRKIDTWSLRVCTLTYVIFLIVLFCTLPLWEESGEDVWPKQGREPDEL